MCSIAIFHTGARMYKKGDRWQMTGNTRSIDSSALACRIEGKCVTTYTQVWLKCDLEMVGVWSSGEKSSASHYSSFHSNQPIRLFLPCVIGEKWRVNLKKAAVVEGVICCTYSYESANFTKDMLSLSLLQITSVINMKESFKNNWLLLNKSGSYGAWYLGSWHFSAAPL